jgi:hypothetical protein
MAINKIEIALAKMARKFTTANSETPKVIEPVTLSQGEKVNKALVKQIASEYKSQILECQDFESFNKLLNLMVGAMNLNLNDDIVTLAKIANAIRAKAGLVIL